MFSRNEVTADGPDGRPVTAAGRAVTSNWLKGGGALPKVGSPGRLA